MYSTLPPSSGVFTLTIKNVQNHVKRFDMCGKILYCFTHLYVKKREKHQIQTV